MHAHLVAKRPKFPIFTSMIQNRYEVIGVMSGTSLDGIDLAHCMLSVSDKGTWSYAILRAETIPYSTKWKVRLQEGIHFSTEQLQVLNKAYTEHLVAVISSFIETHELTNLDAICSHGHTILHRPDKGYTLQIGNLPAINSFSVPVICDFRIADVALGGQGAPLVPIGDQLLFNDYDYCLNLGGFANCSYVSNGVRMAYDICPVNIVLNHFAELFGHPFDKGGKISAAGHVNASLLSALNELPFYKQLAPKSLGLEWVQQHIFPLMAATKISIQDKMATLTTHAAQQLARQFSEGSRVLVTGGGAYNAFLLEQLERCKKLQLVLPEPWLIEYKEALVFGFLGVLKLRNEVNCLSSVTGARKDHSSGVIFTP